MWIDCYKKLEKTQKYTLGQKIDTLFIDIIEGIAIATFLDKKEKQPWIKFSIRKLETIKLLLLVLWEIKALDTKKYGLLNEKLYEIGKMLGGWNGQLTKQNSLEK